MIRDDKVSVNAESTPLVKPPPLERQQTELEVIEGGQSTAVALFQFTTAFFGAGFLALPYGMEHAGIYLGVSLLIVLCLFSRYTIWIMTTIRHRLHKRDIWVEKLTDMGDAAFGYPGRIITLVILCLCQLGFCCAYVVFIIENLNSIAPQLSTLEWLLVVLPVLIVLAWLRDLKYLSPISIIAIICIFAVMIAVVAYGARTQPIDPIHKYNKASVPGLPIVWGIIAFSYCAHNVALPLQQSMHYPDSFDLMATISMTFLCCVYIGFGLLGYFFFKENTYSAITLDLPDSTLIVVVKVALVATLVFVFPLQLFPVTQTLEPTMFPADWPRSKLWPASFIFRAVLVTIVAFVAYAIPNFGLFASFVGAFSVSAVVFVLPPIFYIKLFRKDIGTPELCLNILLVFVGVTGSVAASVVDAYLIGKSLESGASSK